MPEVARRAGSARKAAVCALLVGGALALPAAARAEAAANPVTEGAAEWPVCPRPSAGSVVQPPPQIFSHGGSLDLTLRYLTRLDASGRTLFCFQMPDGRESPTLHVWPGDTLHLTLANRLPPPPPGSPDMGGEEVADLCGAARQNPTSVNIHFHGTNTRPTCHADQVIHTLVNAGQTFRYDVTIPRDEPPGLYWYHPHVHGLSELAVQGGATGAIVVEGIENLQPAVAGLPERLLLLRDQNLASDAAPDPDEPAWDVTLNYVPVAYPQMIPAVLPVRPGRREFWRVANTAADTIMDIELDYDGVAQPLQVVALDGVPTGSQDGTREGKLVTRTHIYLPPAGRAEFIAKMPPPDVHWALLRTADIDTGPDGDRDPKRTLAVLKPSMEAPDAMRTMPEPSVAPVTQRFESIDDAPVAAYRHLFFSEVVSDPTDPLSPTNFYITVDGEHRRLFSAHEPPQIVTHQGQVEEWTIENRSGENHEFHIHQIHFQLRARDGAAVPESERQFLDTINVPYWRGKGYPFPSVTVAMDFRGKIAGDFVYHCHILGHEDDGMMAIIRVLPKNG